MRCAAMRCDAGVCMVSQQEIKGDLKRGRVVRIATTGPTSSADVPGSSSTCSLTLALVLASKDSSLTRTLHTGRTVLLYELSTMRPLAVAIMWLPCLQPDITAQRQ